MNRLRHLAVLAVAVACAALVLPVAAAAMDADELIAKHLEATGSIEKLQAVQSRVASGKFMTQGMEFPFTMTHKRPDLMRVEAQVMGMTMVQCFDGQQGWSINPMTGSQDPQPMGEREQKSFKLQADMDGMFVDWKGKGYAVEYVGEDDVEGTPAYRLRLDTNDDLVVDFWFDQEYFVILKQNSRLTHEGNVIETQSYPSDYQEIDGFVMPMAVETRMGDQVVNQLKLEKIEHNVPVDDAIFVMPAKSEPAAPAVESK